ncbi:Rpn family recombination-promoting nuclease/putative transposase [Desulfonatronovibrio magnus]|uniref:Rpn family recombination-promoting nuclease/putative transposase n=1 Tax=Desulfonatronovibrio magnus TaxID=698827 RepID=UPI0005EBB2B5|nr:Rpn family recombination-promoting nuclease/putative transposase [Desulfonatronovibrio magnus]
MSTPNIHDSTIKYFLSDRQNAISLLKSMLPEKIVKQLDFNKIYYEKDSYLPKSLQSYYSDLVVSVPTKCGSYVAKVFFLLEHKSTFKKNTPLQFLRYILEFWEQYQKNTVETRLPVIIPILIAHPEEGWKPTKLSDLVNLPSDDFKIFIPDFNFLLYDAVNDDPEDYDFDETLKALFTLWRYSRSPEFIQGVQKAFQLIKKVDPEARLLDFVQLLLRYLELTRDEKEYIDIKKIAETEIDKGEVYMGTIAEMFRREGDERTKSEYENKIKEYENQINVLKNEWFGHAMLKNAQETLIDVAGDFHGPLPNSLQDKIKSIDSIDSLRTITRKFYKTQSMEEFSELVNRALQ